MAGSKPPVIKGDGKPASSKSLWTVRGGPVTVQNLEFRGARSGAGLRHEGGELNIERCNSDGLRGGASYEIEIANGGLATVIGNVIGQGADSQNPVLLAYGSEDRPAGSMWRTSGVDPRKVAGRDLSPKSEFEWPASTRTLKAGRTNWAPGAYQR